MIMRACQFNFARTRRTAGSLAGIVILGLAASGAVAPAAQASGSPRIAFTPLLALFGATPAGASTSRTFVLKNTGTAATGTLSVSRGGGAAFKLTADGCSGQSLAAGKSCSVTVAYKPAASGHHDLAILTAVNANRSAVAAAVLLGSSVGAQADLSITKTDGTTAVVPGTSTTYTIVAANNGPSDVTGASIKDAVASGLSGQTWTATSTGGATGYLAAGSGPVNDTVNLPSGSSITYTLTATVASSATGSIANTATIAAPSGVTDANPANNSATDTDTTTPQADLSITKTDGTTTVNPGASTTYTIVATNNGPSDVTGATVADTLPTGLTGATWTSTAGASGTGNIADTVNLPSGSSVTYTLTATVSSSASDTLTLANTATVNVPGGVTDPNPSNNSATDTDAIGATASCVTNCTITTGDPSSSFLTVDASGGSGTVQGAIFTGTLGCTYGTGDLSLDPNTYEVISSSGTFAKTVTLQFPAGSGAPVIDSETDTSQDGDNDYDDVKWNEQVCFQTASGATFNDRGGNPVNVGLLADCPAPVTADTTDPCVDRASSHVTPVGEGGTSYNVVMVVYIPPGIAGDPRMN